MEKISYYTILTASVRLSKNIGASEKLIYSEIAALSRKKGYCFATNNFFAKIYGVSRVSVSNWISKLEKEGFIKTEIIYHGDSKSIKRRKIYLVDFGGLGENYENLSKGGGKEIFNRPHKENFKTPIKENFIYNNTSNISTSIKSVIDSYNNLGGRVRKIEGTASELRKIQSLIESHGLDDLKAAIVKISKSLFLRGLKNDFAISLDFLAKNFDKILEGTYDDYKGYKKKSHKENPKDLGDHEKVAGIVRSLREEFERIKNDQKI